MAPIAFWIIQGPGWLLLAYLVVAQCLPVFSYGLGVRMGTQEPAERITEVGTAFFWGVAFGDLVAYVPLLFAGLLGHWTGADWGDIVLAAALGITIYWPVFCLATVARARGIANWSLPKERDYWIVLPVIALWGTVSLGLLIAAP